MEQQQDQLYPVEARTLHKPLGVCVHQKDEWMFLMNKTNVSINIQLTFNIPHFFQARIVNRLGYRSNTLSSTDTALHLQSKVSLTL